MIAGQLPKGLSDSIISCGYFPEFIQATIARALGDEPIVASVVHHEATFDRDEIHRHVTVLVLTATRLLVNHTDDGDAPGVQQALSTVESVPLTQIKNVALTNVVSDPARFSRATPMDEVWLAVGWGSMRRLEVVPAGCGDPDCDADHGYDLQNLDDDLTVRMSAAADGSENVDRLLSFATTLQQATSTR